ncbi:hypothetical protein JTE90_008437 [Oedothorax gibbosus]|uniref:PSP proline-rich domain-containing protein n=1 Tax=Oedothorax gibbosus TaxID=931172 RepID=A0AAV6UT76_9ARAC|nr:hypothetical protein JTE90_008437 [Oedothorax gibbosus]
MNKCPKKIDRLMIAANKKNILSENSSRYHEEERKNSIKPGVISSELREALSLKNDQLPKHIYTMRIIGYPPGWMDDALFETSGISLYDGEGKTSDQDEQGNSLEPDQKYDSSKFVEFPGFNCPIPSDFTDEWKDLGMPEMQPHHQLTETIKANNTINDTDTNTNKRKNSEKLDDDGPKKIRNGTNDLNETVNNWSPENGSTPKKSECVTLDIQNHTPIDQKLSISLSQSPGTPILKQGNPFEKLPAADKFAQGITDHLLFENLPESVGTFDKMRGILSDVQKKLQNIKKNS